MVFKNLYEAKKWFRNYVQLENPGLISDFWTNYNHKDWKFGDYILFQHIHDGKLISRPIYAIFIDFTIWDQAPVLSLVENKRAWTFSHEVVTNAEYDIKMHICCLDSEIENIVFWDDNIYILGHWKNRPTINELRTSLENTIQHTSEIREGKLSSLLR